MAPSQGPSAFPPNGNPIELRTLPPRANLEHLKHEAKQRLRELRAAFPAAKLSDAQYAVAKAYGFTSWRALKAHVDVMSRSIDAVLAAVKRGDAAALRAILNEHPELVDAPVEDRAGKVRVLPTDTQAMRLLHVAVAENQPEAARVLLECRADPNVRNADGRTPLHDCCELGHDAMRDLLLAHGAEPDATVAAFVPLMDRLRAILDRDPAQANDRRTNLSPIAWATVAWSTDAVRLLLERGAIIHSLPYRDDVAWALTTTASSDALSVLLASGFDVNYRFDDGDTLLHRATRNRGTSNVIAFARVLLDAGLDVNATNNTGQTPLDVALATDGGEVKEHATGAVVGRKRHRDLVALLRDRGGVESSVEDRAVALAGSGRRGELAELLDAHPRLLTVEIAGPWGQPLLHWAAWEGQAEIVDELLKRGIDPNLRDKGDNAYAMHFAAEKGHWDIVKRLVEAGGDIHGEGDDHEMTVLGWATCLGGYHEHVARFLLERGAKHHIFSAIAMNDAETVRRIVSEDPSQLSRRMSRNEHHRGPLHHAVVKNRPDMVRLVLELGADVHARDDSGATPLTYATERADPATLVMLQNAGARLDLTGALRMKRYDVAETLIREEPARVGSAGTDTIALHLSAYRNDLEAVRWLIAHGVDVNAKRVLWGCNQTALHVCTEHDKPAVAQVLLDAGADPNIQDDRFHGTVLGWARYLKRPRIVKLLELRGGAR